MVSEYMKVTIFSRPY